MLLDFFFIAEFFGGLSIFDFFAKLEALLT